MYAQMKNFTLFMISFMICIITHAQSKGQIAVTVQNKQVPVDGATVELLKSGDSSLVKIAVTDKSGRAEFENVSFNDYFLRASFVGMNTQTSAVFTLSESQKEISVPV